tara:strand:+ start:4312 stop:4962 length:651 start_codon:yes stop_codon:yes gene_type:complete
MNEAPAQLLLQSCASFLRINIKKVVIMAGTTQHSRRQFLRSVSVVAGVELLQIAAPAIAVAATAARKSGSAFQVLDEDDAADFAAIAARIIPTTDTPGATEAGVIHFIDQAFAGAMQGSRAFAVAEIAAANQKLDGRFADLDAMAQDELLHGIEDGEFFGLLRVMTIFGFFAMSKYGGNKDMVAWKLIGFDGHHGPWQYPFGYYDAEVHGGDYNGE